MANRPAMLESKPTSAPLYRYTVDQTTATTKYLVAYRAVTLLPLSTAKKDDGSTPNSSIPGNPVPDTVGIRLGETDSKSNLDVISDNVEIHAEDIYIYIGSYFSFREKNLTITANRIFAIDHNGDVNGQIEFDCSGRAGSPYTDAAEKGPEARDAPGPTDAIEDDISHWRSNPGGDGAPGATGRRGGNGGNITMLGRLLVLKDGVSCSLVLNTLGGLGGPGQNGGRGANASICVDGDWIRRLVNHEKSEVDKEMIGNVRRIPDPFALTGRPRMPISMWQELSQSLAGPEKLDVFGTHADIKRSVLYAIGSLMRENPKRFWGKGGIGGKGGNAGLPGASGTVTASALEATTGTASRDSSTGGAFLIAHPLHRNTDVAGGKAGASGAVGKVTSDVLKRCWGLRNSRNKDDDPLPVLGNQLDYPPTPKDGNSINQAITQPASQPLHSPAACHDPTQLLMVLQRLKFEYQMGFGAQPYGNSRAAKNEGDLQETITWVRGYTEQLTEFRNQRTDVLSSQQSAFILSADQFLHNLSTMSDIFGNSITMVMNPTVSLSDAKEEINSLQTLEAMSQAIAAELADGKKVVERQSSTAKAMQRTIEDAGTQVQDISKKMEETYETYLKDRRQLIAMRDSLAGQLAGFWQKIQNDFKYKDKACPPGLGGVLSAAGSALMFGAIGGPAGAAMAGAGGTVSIGGSVVTMVDEMDREETVKKQTNLRFEAIEKRIYRIGDGLHQLKVSDFMKVVREDDPSIADPGHGDYLRSTIMVDRTKFITLCDRYFNDYIQSDDIKDQFDNFLEQAQTLRTTMQTYTSLAISYLQALKDGKMAKDSMAMLMNSNVLLANPSLDLVYNFYVRNVSEQFAAALTTLYQGVRAYNCMTMQRSTALGKLAELQSFENVTGSELSTALNTLRSEIVGYLAQSASNPRVLFEGQRFCITPDSHPSTFKGFQNRGSLALYVFPKDCEKYGLQADWYDVRLQAFRVHLIGAKSMGDKNNMHGHNKNKNILVKASLGPRFHVLDKDQIEHTFEFPNARTTSVSYLAGPGETDFSEKSRSGPIFETSFNFSLNGRPLENIPLATPFTSWKLSVDTKVVDLSGLTDIEVELDVYARTRQQAPVRAMALVASPEVQDVTSPFITTQSIRAEPFVEAYEPGITEPMLYDPFGDIVLVTGPISTLLRNVWNSAKPIILSRLELQLQVFKDSGAVGSTFAHRGLSEWLAPAEPVHFVALPKEILSTLKAPNPRIRDLTNTYNDVKATPSHDTFTKALRITHEALLKGQEKLQVKTNGPSKWQEVSTGGFEHQRGADGGHLGAFGRLVELPEGISDRIKADPSKVPIAHLQSFGSENVICFSAKDSAAMRGNITGYLKQNREAFTRASNTNLEADCIVQLTADSFIDIRRIAIHTAEDGVITTTIHASTTSRHQLDGINIWCTVWDPRAPNQLTTVNFLIGKSKVWGVDVVNLLLGDFMMAHAGRVAPHAIEALHRGVHINEYLAQYEPELWKMHCKYIAIQRVFGPTAADIRSIFGPTTVEAVDMAKVAAQGIVLLHPDMPGIEIRLSSKAVTAFQSDAELPNDTLTAAEKAAQEMMSESDMARVKRALALVTDTHATAAVKAMTATGSVVPTGEAVHEQLVRSLVYAEAQLSAVMLNVVTADSISALEDRIGFDKAAVPPELVSSIATQVMLDVAQREMTGTVEAVVLDTVDTVLAREVKPADVNRIVTDAIDLRHTTGERLRKLQEDRKKRADGADDKEIQQLEKAIKEAQKKMAEAVEKAKRVTQEAEQADSERKNADKRMQERNRDARELADRKGREQAERDRLKAAPKRKP